MSWNWKPCSQVWQRTILTANKKPKVTCQKAQEIRSKFTTTTEALLTLKPLGCLASKVQKSLLHGWKIHGDPSSIYSSASPPSNCKFQIHMCSKRLCNSPSLILSPLVDTNQWQRPGPASTWKTPPSLNSSTRKTRTSLSHAFDAKYNPKHAKE